MSKILPVGGSVEVAVGDEWVPTQVIDLLATQFTCEVEGKHTFLFYSDKNLTWRQLRENGDQ